MPSLPSYYPSWWRQYQYGGIPSEMGWDILTQQPGAAWSLITRPTEQYGPTGFTSWLKGNQNRYHNQYVADQAMGNVGLNTNFYEWASGNLGGRFDPLADFRRLSPYERGERPSAFAGRARWVP